MGGGGRKRVVPANTVDTLRGERKGDPQHKCCGTKRYIGSEDSKYLCVVEIVFQDPSLYKKRKDVNQEKWFQRTRSTLRAEEKATLYTNVMGKTLGSEDSKYRCVVEIGFQEISLS